MLVLQIGVLTRLRNLIPTPAKLQLFKAAILLHLIYCSTVWYCCRASDRRKLQRLQERALRTVVKSRSDSYENLLLQANLPTLYNRRILMFEAKNKPTTEVFTRPLQPKQGKRKMIQLKEF